MPTKIGMGGEGQEQYNPNNGKYVEDGIPNKSYDNPNENINRLFGLLNKSKQGKNFGEKRKQFPYFGKKFLKKYNVEDLYSFAFFADSLNPIKESFFNEANEYALQQIQEETGYSYEKALELQGCLIDYFGGDYREFRSGNKPVETKIIDEGLKRMGAYDGNIYRGMTFNSKDPKQFEQFQSLANNLQIGNILNMNSIASWSSKKNVAMGFATIYDEARDDNYFTDYSVLFVVKNNKTAVGMQHISKFGDGESEVLSPSTAKYTVKNKKIKNDNGKIIIVAELEEI